MLPVVNLDNLGLFTFNNLLSKVPPGAMTIANNINIDRPATTSATTYKVQMRVNNGGATATFGDSSVVSVLIAEEII